MVRATVHVASSSPHLRRYLSAVFHCTLRLHLLLCTDLSEVAHLVFLLSAFFCLQPQKSCFATSRNVFSAVETIRRYFCLNGSQKGHAPATAHQSRYICFCSEYSRSTRRVLLAGERNLSRCKACPLIFQHVKLTWAFLLVRFLFNVLSSVVTY